MHFSADVGVFLPCILNTPVFSLGYVCSYFFFFSPNLSTFQSLGPFCLASPSPRCPLRDFLAHRSPSLYLLHHLSSLGSPSPKKYFPFFLFLFFSVLSDYYLKARGEQTELGSFHPWVPQPLSSPSLSLPETEPACMSLFTPRVNLRSILSPCGVSLGWPPQASLSPQEQAGSRPCKPMCPHIYLGGVCVCRPEPYGLNSC